MPRKNLPSKPRDLGPYVPMSLKDKHKHLKADIKLEIRSIEHTLAAIKEVVDLGDYPSLGRDIAELARKIPHKAGALTAQTAALEAIEHVWELQENSERK